MLSRPLIVTLPVSLLKLAMLRLSDLLMGLDVMWLFTWIPSTCISSEGISPPQTRWWISQHKLPPPRGLWSRLSANYWTFFYDFFLASMLWCPGCDACHNATCDTNQDNEIPDNLSSREPSLNPWWYLDNVCVHCQCTRSGLSSTHCWSWHWGR